MSKTPSRSVEITTTFSPKVLKTPNKDLPEIARTVFNHVLKLHELTLDWRKLRSKATNLCKTIVRIKQKDNLDFEYTSYPDVLAPLSESLTDAAEGLKSTLDGIELVLRQLRAIAKLQPDKKPVISTWCAQQIADEVENIFTSLQKEYRVKEIITENIAHCSDPNQLEVYATAWEIDTYFNIESTAYLFAEVGLTAIA